MVLISYENMQPIGCTIYVQLYGYANFFQVFFRKSKLPVESVCLQGFAEIARNIWNNVILTKTYYWNGLQQSQAPSDGTNADEQPEDCQCIGRPRD
jgi:hypothetical protein